MACQGQTGPRAFASFAAPFPFSFSNLRFVFTFRVFLFGVSVRFPFSVFFSYFECSLCAFVRFVRFPCLFIRLFRSRFMRFRLVLRLCALCLDPFVICGYYVLLMVIVIANGDC